MYLSLCVCMRVYVYVCVYVCMCLYVCHTYNFFFVIFDNCVDFFNFVVYFSFVYVCVCVYVLVGMPRWTRKWGARSAAYRAYSASMLLVDWDGTKKKVSFFLILPYFFSSFTFCVLLFVVLQVDLRDRHHR